ncbi:MAG: DUF2283 domain-containing protein [Tepidisphaeraceae bacterium]
MSKPYLEITYRLGRPFAAYLYLSRQAGDRVQRSVPHGPLVVDYTQDGRPIGVEITGVSASVPAVLRQLLADLQVQNVDARELAPLGAA